MVHRARENWGMHLEIATLSVFSDTARQFLECVVGMVKHIHFEVLREVGGVLEPGLAPHPLVPLLRWSAEELEEGLPQDEAPGREADEARGAFLYVAHSRLHNHPYFTIYIQFTVGKPQIGCVALDNQYLRIGKIKEWEAGIDYLARGMSRSRP